MKRLFCVLSVCALAGCAAPMSRVEPDDPEYAPVMPEDPTEQVIPTGSLFNSQYANNLYSDMKARRVGDIIIVNLVESTRAQKSAKSELSKDNSLNMGAITLPTGPVTYKGSPVQLGLSQNNDFTGEADADQSNSLQGTISVNVVKVLPNGNLAIRGEKWLMLNNGNEYIRLTGIIRPDDIGNDNQIDSQRVANARIQYGGTGEFAETQRQGWLTRFFSGPWWPI